MLPLAESYQTVLAGGDTNVWGAPLAINVTVLARPTPRGPLLRSTASPGDVLFVTGCLGGSARGHHFDFEPRIHVAQALHAEYALSAGMDLSDGLATDAARLAQQSRCGIEIDTERIPLRETVHALVAAGSGRSAVDHALGDGEDFELLFAAPPAEARRLEKMYRGAVPVTRIGTCIDAPGVGSSTPTTFDGHALR